MYKDKDKQREANRAAKQRSRQGMTQDNPVIPDVIPSNVIPDKSADVIPEQDTAAPYGRLASGRPVIAGSVPMADLPNAYISDLVYDKRNAEQWYGSRPQRQQA